MSVLAEPFTASAHDCELVTILPEELQRIAETHPDPLRFFVAYAATSTRTLNCESNSTAYGKLVINNLQPQYSRTIGSSQ